MTMAVVDDHGPNDAQRVSHFSGFPAVQSTVASHLWFWLKATFLAIAGKATHSLFPLTAANVSRFLKLPV